MLRAYNANHLILGGTSRYADNPTTKGDWLGVAFKQGDGRNVFDDIVMGATWGSWVHCELVIARNTTGKAYAAFQGGLGFMPSPSEPSPPGWAMFALPVTDPAAVKAHALSLLALELPYNYGDLWQCWMSAMLPWETELDCARPESWKTTGVFCSQVALLFIRQMSRQQAVVLPSDTQALVEATHSRGCSPNMLFELLSRSCLRVF